MAIMKTDSPFCRRIAVAFLKFLNKVEPAPDADIEGLEVARECLAEVFKIDQSAVDNWAKSDCLVDMFSAWETNHDMRSDASREVLSADAPSTSSAHNAAYSNLAEASQSLGENWTGEPQTKVFVMLFAGTSEDELFGKFLRALEKIHYFSNTPGHDDQALVERAGSAFFNALTELQNSGCWTNDQKDLAETFKSQGNKALKSKLFPDAIELYTYAIAICEDNAVYYCNRAAAYTQINQFSEAIRDCLKSIEIDPNYSKAYSRLGFAYYAQGSYRDAIDKGFLKALQLDPSNVSVEENILVAEQKLREEQQRTERDQVVYTFAVRSVEDPTFLEFSPAIQSYNHKTFKVKSSSSANRDQNQQSAGGSSHQSTAPPFTSMPFNANGLTTDIASMLMNMAANVQGQHSQDGPGGSEPEVRIGGNVNVNLGDQMPQDLTGALRSVMEMLSGAASHGNTQDNMNGRPASS
ncbi:hypothetical protein RJ639_001572 [Escallonia herrerae]|uniref:SGTA homodimerisation domain-containing protein n=1 Tax=Escallonia herrerae TaxID=1293975 RepID=A0AA88XB96_9ASTE|nr:hypothetical protein RJ639_001572 [Escallonia herrerae]